MRFNALHHLRRKAPGRSQRWDAWSRPTPSPILGTGIAAPHCPEEGTIEQTPACETWNPSLLIIFSIQLCIKLPSCRSPESPGGLSWPHAETHFITVLKEVHNS